MKKLYFIRHGESTANVQRLFAGRWDIPLSEKGKTQAKLAGKDANGLGIDCIISSPLLRAKQTAEIIGGGIGFPLNKIQYSDLLMERDYGDLQGTSFDDISGIDFEVVANIEPLRLLEERAAKALQEIKNIEEDSILVVGHGTLGRALYHCLINSDEEIEVPISEEIPNAKIVRWI